MKKLLALALIGWFCGSALAQPNTTPAAPAPTATPPTTSTAAPQNSAPSGVVGERSATYSDRIPPEQIITLDASGDKFQARHIADLSGLPRGAVIILHDSGQHPTWPFTAAALIDDLPLHGWDTLNIELPTPAVATSLTKTPTPAEPPATTPPPATKNPAPAANANAANAATPTPAIGIEPQTQARISAAIKYYFDQNQRNIVLIGFGSGAIRAAETLRLITTANTATSGTNPSTNSTPITALVMIAPQQQLNGINMDLPKLLPLTGISALDMTLDSEPQARAEADARRRAVLHQRTRIYTRLELPPINNSSDAQHSAMVKRVRAWLQINAHPQQKPAETKPQNTAPEQP